MHKGIPYKSIVPNLLSGIDYSKLINNQVNDLKTNKVNKEIKGRSLTLNKRINNYHNKNI